MQIISVIFNDFLYRPLFNILVFFYNIVPGHDFGIAIILITFLIRLILFPLSRKSIKSRKDLEELQPKIKAIQQKYKDKSEQAKYLMTVYKEHKVNPASGCLPLLIQLPILFALYRVFIGGTDPNNLSLLYPFIKNPGFLKASFLGLVDLSVANTFLAILAGIFQFIQGKVMFKTSLPETQPAEQKANFQKALSRQMIYFMPVITVFIALKFPAGLALYWIISTLFGTGEYLIINRKKTLIPKTQ